MYERLTWVQGFLGQKGYSWLPINTTRQKIEPITNNNKMEIERSLFTETVKLLSIYIIMPSAMQSFFGKPKKQSYKAAAIKTLLKPM